MIEEETPIDDLYMMALEEKAAELEITVDYYIAEFLWFEYPLEILHIVLNAELIGLLPQYLRNGESITLGHTSFPVLMLVTI